MKFRGVFSSIKRAERECPFPLPLISVTVSLKGAHLSTFHYFFVSTIPDLRQFSGKCATFPYYDQRR